MNTNENQTEEKLTLGWKGKLLTWLFFVVLVSGVFGSFIYFLDNAGPIFEWLKDHPDLAQIIPIVMLGISMGTLIYKAFMRSLEREE